MTDKRHPIAHELRNLLGLIALEVHAATASVADPEATRQSLAEISTLIARCVEVVASLEASTSATASRDLEPDAGRGGRQCEAKQAESKKDRR
jgi:hypothetical protein